MARELTSLELALSKCWTSLAAVVLFSFAINLLMLTVPIYMLQLINSVIPNRSVDTLILLTGLVVVGLFALSLLEGIRGRVLVQIGYWLNREIAGDVLGSSIFRSLRRGRSPSIQGLRDLSTVRSFLTGSDLLPVMDLPWTPIFVFVIFLLHPLVGFITLVGAAILFILALVNEAGTRNILAEANDANDDALDHAHSLARNSDVIHAMGMRGNIVALWDAKNDGALSLKGAADHRSARIKGMARFVRTCLQVTVLATAAYLAIQGQIAVGAMIACLLLMRRAISPLERSISAWKSIQSARRAYQRLNARLKSAERVDQRLPRWTPAGTVSVKKLYYAPSTGASSIIRNVSFDLEAGSALGIVGPSGAGKSTLAALILGNVEPTSGTVQMDGIDMHIWDREHLGPYLGFLPQNVELFAGTVRENIARMGPGDPDLVVQAAKFAGVHDMIIHLPDGYDTDIGDEGTILSGGQRQRVGLARAIYGFPKLVVLDEPDANLDRDGQAALSNAIQELKSRGTSIVLITHRTEMLQLTEKVLMLARGRAEIGPSEAVKRGPQAIENADEAPSHG